MSDSNETTEAPLRHAVVRGHHTRLDQIRRYLPANYTADSDGSDVFIHGRDYAGWTLDDYVIPRLASGLYHAEEVSTRRTLYAIFRMGSTEPIWAKVTERETAEQAAVVAAVNGGNVELLSGADLAARLTEGTV